MIETRSKNVARRRWNCPSESKVASYLEQHLEEKEKARFETHLADCDFCMGVIGALVRQQRASEPIEVPAHLLRKAIEAVPAQTSSKVSWRWLLAPALASIVVVSVVVVLKLPRPQRVVAPMPARTVETAQSPVATPQPSSRPPEKEYVRKMATRGSILQMVEPMSNSVVQRAGLRFRWKPVANAIYYEIRLVNPEGDLVWQEQDSGATAQLPPHLSLRPGKYFVWVRAYLNDGKTIKSNAIGFSIGS